MQKRKDVLTTGQVAQICNVAPRTVTKWFDSGQLKGYRIPGSKDRRIPTCELIKFMKSHDMPTESLETSSVRILLIDSNEDNLRKLSEKISSREDFDVQTASNSFDAGLIAQKINPHIMLINLMANNINADQICEYVRSDKELSATKVIAVASGLRESETNALLEKGFDGALSNLEDTKEVFNVIEDVFSFVY